MRQGGVMLGGDKVKLAIPSCAAHIVNLNTQVVICVWSRAATKDPYGATRARLVVILASLTLQADKFPAARYADSKNGGLLP